MRPIPYQRQAHRDDARGAVSLRDHDIGYPKNDEPLHHVLLGIFRVTQRNVGPHRMSYDDSFRRTDALARILDEARTR